jgi:cell division septation protein DedD
MASKTDEADWEIGTYRAQKEFHGRPNREERPNVRLSWRPKRSRAFMLAAMLIASAAVFFYFSMPADYAIHKRATSANPTSGHPEIGLRPPNASTNDTAGLPANQNADTVTDSPSTGNNTVQASETDSGVNEPGVQRKTDSVADSAVISNLPKKWSVQISAAPAKDIADTLVLRLKAKGYDGYVVTAAVKGQTYYRVRVGQFDSREEAESVRQSLARREGYRDAYLTGD